MAKNMLITKAEMTKLLANGAKSASGDHDPKPVVKLFNPTGAGTWLITEIDPTDPTRAFGLADIGHGMPELGYISLSELEAFRGRFNLKIERDRHFTASKTLSEYADAARDAGAIRA
jgi:hypothetical protein